ncbi:acetate/propionate family kinase [Opitutus sp. GAS368]|jgi:acetate kinase|uniref:acetate/propionate family kinase n=1 Tax=Opitutus sp. GAS368 TaxID=1882749 RepID=UPI00087B06B0|nr:acetate/propionate family kinase [Opitutus sp. GAS368]SDR66681.1 acetate kinase [Opitutus sp. GAS368]
MKRDAPRILTLNGGSSSIRFAIYRAGKTPECALRGRLDRIGSSRPSLVATDSAGGEQVRRLSGRRAPEEFLLDWLEAQPVFASVQTVGHRVVHGLRHFEPERVTPRLLAGLKRLTPYDPEHLPREIGLMETFRRRHPRLIQVACFDTAFHRGMPRVARMLAIPRRYAAQGVERYGFHGLSYAYLREELARLDPAAARGRVILAHLGNGASLTAMRGGQSIDTSMGFTPAAGLMMGTRSGDLDPGLFSFLVRSERMAPPQFDRMVNHESGLLGVSGTSGDMRDLLARETRDARAADAVALFCYQARKWIGAYAAALGGLDTLVFAGGIGENAPVIRQRICAGLGFLGITLHRGHNAENAPLISAAAGRVKVRVIRTDEELMIARSVGRLLHLGRIKP